VSFIALVFLGLVFGVANISTPATQPKLFCLLWLFTLLCWGFALFLLSPAAHTWLLPEQCDSSVPVFANPEGEIVILAIIGALLLGGALWFRHLSLATFIKRIETIEGQLPERLGDKSLRLLRVEWLRAQSPDWVLLRRQELPEEAFWSPADSKRLLREGKVAALSYKWQGPFNSKKEGDEKGGDQPDGERFHLNVVLAYYRAKEHRAKEHPALMWDFAALPQHNPKTGEIRSPEDQKFFTAGLKVMSNCYASPRVLVLQHRRIPLELEHELDNTHHGKPPANRLDLVPYAGKHSRSGWCTFETACAMLMTRGGGHTYELGVGRVPVAAHGRLPSEQVMKALFEDPSTQFMGNAVRKDVTDLYLDLRKELVEYDELHMPWLVREADKLMKDDDMRAGFKRVFLVVVIALVLVVLGILFCLSFVVRDSTLVLIFMFFLLCFLLLVALLTLSSRIVRAHLAAVFCCRSRNSLDYTFHCSLYTAPFRKRTTETAAQSGVEPVVPTPVVPPDCFLPRNAEHRSSHGESCLCFRKIRGTPVAPT